MHVKIHSVYDDIVSAHIYACLHFIN